jgi:L-ascorbate metabolism protein UlaG (beta-lactamase superfamily)
MSYTFIYYGHGTYGLHVGDHKVVIDPYFNNNPAAKVSVDEVPAEFILVSHGHGDHTEDVEPLAKRTKALIIANKEISDYYAARGYKTHGQHIGGGLHHPFGFLKLTQAVHGSEFPDGSSGGAAAGLLVTTPDKKRIYMACDTGLFGDMRLIGDEGIDLAVLPIGDNYTMGPDDALKAVQLIRPKHVVPVHYNTWDLIKQDGEAWGKRVAKETSAIPHVMQPGESITL